MSYLTDIGLLEDVVLPHEAGALLQHWPVLHLPEHLLLAQLCSLHNSQQLSTRLCPGRALRHGLQEMCSKYVFT